MFNRELLPQDFAQLISPVTWVRGPRTLERVVEQLAKVSQFAIDTETGGNPAFREPINSRLSLIQLFIPRRDRWGNLSAKHGRTVIIDVLKLEEWAAQHAADPKVLEPLKAVLANPKIKKIIHHQAFERDQFERRNISIEGAIDTERLARELRPDLLSFSLGAVNFEVRGVAMQKDLQDSNWLQRPLTQQQMQYAALDPQETYFVFQSLQDIQATVAVDCEYSIEGLCQNLSVTRAQHHNLMRQHSLDVILPRIERCIELVRDLIKQQAISKFTSNGSKEPLRLQTEYGSVAVDQQTVRSINFMRLNQLHPQVAAQVIKEACTQEDIKEALRASNFKNVEINKQISELYSSNSETIKVDFERSVNKCDFSDDQLIKFFGIDKTKELPDLMQKLVLLSGQGLTLKRNAAVGNELAVLERRCELLERLIEAELITLAQDDNNLSEYIFSDIEIKIKRTSRRSLNIELFRERFPEVAEQLLKPHVSMKDLQSAFAALGLEVAEANTLISGCVEKHSKGGNVSVSIYPRFAKLYQFYIEPEEQQELRRSA